MTYSLYFLSTKDNEAFFCLFFIFFILITSIIAFPLQDTTFTLPPGTLAPGLGGGRAAHQSPATGGFRAKGPGGWALLATLPPAAPATGEHRRKGHKGRSIPGERRTALEVKFAHGFSRGPDGSSSARTRGWEASVQPSLP